MLAARSFRGRLAVLESRRLLASAAQAKLAATRTLSALRRASPVFAGLRPLSYRGRAALIYLTGKLIFIAGRRCSIPGSCPAACLDARGRGFPRLRLPSLKNTRAAPLSLLSLERACLRLRMRAGGLAAGRTRTYQLEILTGSRSADACLSLITDPY